MLTLLYFLSPCKTKLIPEGAGSLVVCVVDVTLRLAESHKLFRIDKTLRWLIWRLFVMFRWALQKCTEERRLWTPFNWRGLRRERKYNNTRCSFSLLSSPFDGYNLSGLVLPNSDIVEATDYVHDFIVINVGYCDFFESSRTTSNFHWTGRCGWADSLLFLAVPYSLWL